MTKKAVRKKVVPKAAGQVQPKPAGGFLPSAQKMIDAAIQQNLALARLERVIGLVYGLVIETAAERRYLPTDPDPDPVPAGPRDSSADLVDRLKTAANGIRAMHPRDRETLANAVREKSRQESDNMCAAMPVAPENVRIVDSSLIDLERSLRDMERGIDELLTRIGPVCRGGAPLPPVPPGSFPCNEVPIVSVVGGMIGRVQAITEWVRHGIDVLEV